MGKSKYAPALFEVIHKRQDNKPKGAFAPPKWWRSDKGSVSEASARTPATEKAAGKKASTQPPPPAPAASTASPPVRPEQSKSPDPAKSTWRLRLHSAPAGPDTADPATPGRDSGGPNATRGSELKPPMVDMANGRLRFSLNPTSLAVVAGVLLLVLFATYQLGRGLGPVPPPTAAEVAADQSLQDALAQTPDPSVLKAGSSSSGTSLAALSGQARPGVEKSPAGTAQEEVVQGSGNSVERQPGMNYVVVESFSLDHLESAQFVQKWLAAKYGLHVTLNKKDGRWVLLSIAGFENRAQYEPYIENILSFGNQCGADLAKAGLPVYKLAAPFAVRWK